jgi:hypothetical protein
MMKRAVVVATSFVLLGVLIGHAELPPASFAIGFAVGVPYRFPVAWDESFSYLTAEALLSPNLTLAFDFGAYPGSFPDLFEGGASVLVKAWLGPSCLFAGGGLSMRWLRVGTAWAMSPYFQLEAGFQTWMLENLAFVVQYRTIEVLPITWTFSPEISLGLSLALGRARPETLEVDGQTLWLLTGLGVAALIAFLPRK